MRKVNLIASVAHQPCYEDGDFIGVDGGSEYLIKQGLPIVAIIGDFDSLKPKLLNEVDTSKIKVMRLNPIKDHTDLDMAIQWVKTLNYDQINIYGAIGQRIDHSLININLLKKNRDVIFYDDYSCLKVLKKGIHYFTSTDCYYSFFSIESETIINLNGFKYDLVNYHLASDDTLCVSNEIACNQARVECNKDIIVVLSR
ncbi:MAG: thiamine diphosphokinase [Bacilli bacterium]|jgi:thiamine pyrophosphokinase|nr:thiamine diphosphokinase [Bacilli bacterium]